MVEVLVWITADMTEYEYEYDWDISKWLVGGMVSIVDNVKCFFEIESFDSFKSFSSWPVFF